jgi:hypothetical protein
MQRFVKYLKRKFNSNSFGVLAHASLYCKLFIIIVLVFEIPEKAAKKAGRVL